MTELEKKVFREVFIGKAVKFDNKEQLDNIKRFYKDFNVGYLGYEYIGILGSKRGLIKLNDNLNAYYLADIIYEKKYTFDELFDLYRLTLRNKRFLNEFKDKKIKVNNQLEQDVVVRTFNKYGFHWASGASYVKFEKEHNYLGISTRPLSNDYMIFRITDNKEFLSFDIFNANVKWFEKGTYTLDPKKASSDFKLDADVMRAEIMRRSFEATSKLYNRHILGIREEYKPLPNKIAFRNDTTTLIYDDFKVVRAKASNKDEAIRETGLLIALLKALNVKDYNTIIANAWDTENELTRHFYLYGVVQQLYVDKKLLSRNQFNKLFEAVGDKKPNVNIGGKIIEVEYK